MSVSRVLSTVVLLAAIALGLWISARTRGPPVRPRARLRRQPLTALASNWRTLVRGRVRRLRAVRARRRSRRR